MSETLHPGTDLLKGRYELLETLGSGGEGRVVKALDHLHERTVALKLRHVGGAERREGLLREARVLLSLTPHASLPLVREDFFEGDQYVIVMDWVDGTDLARLVRAKGTPGLALPNVLAYMAEAAEALTFLHTHDPPIIHGDVKPANLILTRGGHVKLVDFGLSSTPGTTGQEGGTFGFLAPELIEGSPPSRASDIYALAATAFALLAGAAPGGVSPGLHGLDAEHAASLHDALDAGLATDPAGRPSTPGELVERMRAGWLSTLPTGVMTFCMSDVEGSTRMWETHPSLMAESLVRHDELIASVVEEHGGRFVKSMGEGDSTVSVFESATQALRAALDAARALADTTWPDGAPIRARFGLHTGEAQMRGGNYFGTGINLAARVRGAADGGEILMSEVTADLVAPDLPRGYSIVDLGRHHLKGIERPEAIKALVGPGLMTAPKAADCPYRGLLAFEPGDRHLFFGREQVLHDALSRIAAGHLLAVIGASGSGKSSLLRAGVLAAVRNGEVPGMGEARLITPGADPKLDIEGPELLVVDQFEELYTQCRDAARRASFIAALLARRGPVVIGVRADFYGEISADAELADAVAQNQVLLGPMRDDDLRRAIAEPARLAGLKLEPGLIDLVLRDVAGEPGALPLMSHALRETWERRDGRTLTVAAYHESGGVSSAVAQTADAVADGTPEADRPLLRNVFLRLTELGDDVEDTRRRVRIDELVPQGAAPETVRALLERLSDARLVTLGEGTAEVAHEVLIRRWPTLRRWLDEDREGIRLHRRLGDAARLWIAAGRGSEDLYRGARLDAASEWARTNGALLNGLERDFLTASVDESAREQRRQMRANRRLRQALSVAGVMLPAAIALLVFALISRHNSVQAEANARSQALATEAEAQLTRDPQRSLLLARAALAAAPTAPAELAASEALDANTVRSQLPPFGPQGCLTANFLFLFDGGRLAADNTCDGHVVFANLATRKLVRSIRVGPSSTDMVIGPARPGGDGFKTLIVATGRDLVSVDVATGAVRHIFTAPFPIDQVAGGAAPAGYLAIADNDTVALADLRTGRTHVIAHGDASANVVNGMMVAGYDTLLVATTGQTTGHGDLYPGITDLNVFTGSRRTVSLSHGSELGAVNFLRVSPDLRTWYITGSQINANSNAEAATTWAVDASTGRIRWVALGPAGAIASPIQTSPDGRLVAVGYSSGASDVLDATTGALVVREASSASIAAGDLAIPAGDNSLVTVSLDGYFRTWATHGSEQLLVHAPPDPAVDFTPDGTDLVLVGDHGEIVSRVGGRVLRTFPGFPAGSVFNTCNSACFSSSPELRWLTYVDSRAATPRIVEIDGETGQQVAAVTVPRLDAQGVAPNGEIVTAYVDNGSLYAELIDPRSGQTRALQTGQSSPGCAATQPAFTPDSRLMAIVDGCINLDIWNVQTGRIVRTIILPDRSNNAGARLTPDGRYALVTVLGGAFVRANIGTGTSIQIPGAAAEGNVLAVAPDGRWYAIGRQDGTVDVYDARRLRLVRHHQLINPIQALAFSPDSQALAVEDTSDTVRVWDTCSVCENPTALAALARAQTVRQLTPGERATFNVG